MSKSEASLFGVLKESSLWHGEFAERCEEQLSCLLSLFVLGCRNGVSVVARVDVLEAAVCRHGYVCSVTGCRLWVRAALTTRSVFARRRILCGMGLAGI